MVRLNDDIDRLLDSARIAPTNHDRRTRLNEALQQAHWDWWYTSPARHRRVA